jgi:hypothetical protein
MVVIRVLACRFCTLVDLRLSHIVVIDDDASPLGATLRIRIPKSKADIMGTKGGALMRIYAALTNRYLCPVYVLSLWLLFCQPFLEKAIADLFNELVRDSLRCPYAYRSPLFYCVVVWICSALRWMLLCQMRR